MLAIVEAQSQAGPVAQYNTPCKYLCFLDFSHRIVTGHMALRIKVQSMDSGLTTRLASKLQQDIPYPGERQQDFHHHEHLQMNNDRQTQQQKQHTTDGNNGS